MKSDYISLVSSAKPSFFKINILWPGRETHMIKYPVFFIS
jgi:hypothetical protein